VEIDKKRSPIALERCKHKLRAAGFEDISALYGQSINALEARSPTAPPRRSVVTSDELLGGV